MIFDHLVIIFKEGNYFLGNKLEILNGKVRISKAISQKKSGLTLMHISFSHRPYKLPKFLILIDVKFNEIPPIINAKQC